MLKRTVSLIALVAVLGVSATALNRPKSKGRVKTKRRPRQRRQVSKPARWKKLIQFIELLVIPSGKGVGSPFKLDPLLSHLF